MIQKQNDYQIEVTPVSRTRRVVLLLNVFFALITVVFGILAVVDPLLVSGHGTVNATVELYVQAYMVRAVSIGVVVAVVAVMALRRDARGLLPVLLVAGLSQVGDVVIGVSQGIPGMAAGGLLCAVVHLGSAAWLRRS
ncbi:MAG TPA: hypothetical protein VE172_15795 [Stackebrandtia sp.]|jgi:type IV secretory pathway TrbD component|uniref:hypothetical protein n=1 Tax=Stackebrandtia sp. TaxID=2023065 RepID=UPI002D40E626|nr:hypothetical protein [Stackebrandtia sp.]HZE40267.1 hypothetical protein [Stackebrandtia sp.]